ncbi:MAG: NADH-quinone oxidoreductase subunit A [Bdellovibrionales bacterium]|nr:NADH-quinone oxidoreductase subunit A [Bdellovibrionales bacterium]
MPLFAVLFLLVFILIFGTVLLLVTPLLAKVGLGQKPKASAVKSETYECGLPEQVTGNSKISVKFYLTAILFILFDIEIIFMYPWATAFVDFVKDGHGLYILGTMGFFLLIFIYGLFWEIKSKALEWE